MKAHILNSETPDILNDDAAIRNTDEGTVPRMNAAWKEDEPLPDEITFPEVLEEEEALP